MAKLCQLIFQVNANFPLWRAIASGVLPYLILRKHADRGQIAEV